MRTFTVPASARKQAEVAVRHDLGDVDTARFRAEQANEVEAVRRSAFEDPVEGPIAIVCGQYSLPDKTGSYGPNSWFFVAIKQGKVLWTTTDKDGASGDAYESCKGAGLTPDRPREMPDG